MNGNDIPSFEEGISELLRYFSRFVHTFYEGEYRSNMTTLGVHEDLRYAFRLIAGNRTLSAAVFLSLTLGIGASASMFGAVDALLFRPLPAPRTDRIVRITSGAQSDALGL